MQAVEHLIDESLECLSSVPQPKGHSHKLKQPERSSDSCLRDVIGVDGV